MQRYFGLKSQQESELVYLPKSSQTIPLNDVFISFKPQHFETEHDLKCFLLLLPSSEVDQLTGLQ